MLTSHDEMDRFCCKYVSMFLLAEERGRHFRRVLEELNAQGIEPEFRTEKIGARFYARPDVMPDSHRPMSAIPRFADSNRRSPEVSGGSNCD